MKRLLAILLLSIMAQQGAWGQTTPSILAYLNNKKASSLLKENKFDQAKDLFLKALKADPKGLEILLNLGIAYEGSGALDQALSAYATVEKLSDDPATKFMASFNIGQLKAKQKKIDEALADYQRALSYNSLSIETKTNIELLLQSQQSGGGGGDQNQEEQNKEDQKNDQEPKEFDKNPKQKPKKFNSKELTEDDVRKILGELKSQEQKIRAEFDKENKRSQERPNEKDW